MLENVSVEMLGVGINISMEFCGYQTLQSLMAPCETLGMGSTSAHLNSLEVLWLRREWLSAQTLELDAL